MKVMWQGMDIDVECRTGFTVYNQDGTSYVQVHMTPHVPPMPDGPGGGEPLPEPRVA